jgi:hypothetical protein
MADDLNTMDAFTAKIVPLRTKGFSFEEIAVRTGADVEEVVSVWKEFIASRTIMTPEEQMVLQELRLEVLLTQVNDRLRFADRAEDYQLVIDLLKEIAKLQGINKENKRAAENDLVQLTNAQTALILQAVFALGAAMTEHVEQAFEKHKTIKAIKGELAGNALTTLFNAEAQRVLAQQEGQES